MISSYQAGADVDVLTTSADIPGFGSIAINAFVLHGREPVLVDTGAVVDRDEFMEALRAVIDPAALKYIWLTHTDFDHIGALPLLLAENTDLRVITTFLGVGIMGLTDPLPLDRVNFVNPGETIAVGDRSLTAVKPPVFDNACTTGFYDGTSGALFTSDCFGALLSAVPENAADLTEDELRQGQVFWATVDSPWLHSVDESAFLAELGRLRTIEPRIVLSSHLPPAPGDMFDTMLASLAAVPAAERFVGPDQAALDQMLSQMAVAPT
jgi:flavorubredoxin